MSEVRCRRIVLSVAAALVGASVLAGCGADANAESGEPATPRVTATPKPTKKAAKPKATAKATAKPKNSAKPKTPPPGAYYASCKEAKAAGVTPLYFGQPGYSSDLDPDGDGTACA
jgi:hypothetical protein